MTAKKTTQKKRAKKPTTKKTARSTQSSVKKESKDQGTVFLIATVVIVTLVLVAFRLFTQEPASSAFSYHHFPFTMTQDGFWFVSVEINGQLYKVIFRYHPTELEYIPVADGMAAKIIEFANKQGNGEDVELFVTMDPDTIIPQYAMAGVEIVKITGERNHIFNIPSHSAITHASEDFPLSTPIKSCADADENTLIIWIKEGERAGVDSPVENCIIVKGTTANETIKVADRLMYQVLTVMD